MTTAAPATDADLLDLMRVAGPLSVLDLADALQVTSTAVRQRLARVMEQGSVQREAVNGGRGRPKHRYWLTEKGLRLTGSNFTDLAKALWHEMSTIEDPQLRREMLARIARALATDYAGQIAGETVAERMRSLADLLAQRRIPVRVEEMRDHPTLTASACPYPSLAEQDRGVCAMEKIMFSQLLGGDVELTHCRLDGGHDCRFQAK